MKKFIGYYRDSKVAQGLNGMVLYAQMNSVYDYVSFKGELIKGFIEEEPETRKNKHIEIYKAINWAKKVNAVLIIANLDRLARDVEFTSVLLNSGVDFICCDYPGVNKSTIQIINEIAENEMKAKSAATKEGLKAKKARIESKNYTNKDASYMKPDSKGKYRLGNPNGFKAEHRRLGIQKIKENALNDNANKKAMEVIWDKRKQGLSYQKIAAYLNKSGYTTRYGKEFKPIQVQRLFKRCEKEDSFLPAEPIIYPSINSSVISLASLSVS